MKKSRAEVDSASSMYGGDEKYTQSFGGNARRKYTSG
jgi:hypothetical protein